MSNWNEKILSTANKLSKGIEKGADYIASLNTSKQEATLQLPQSEETSERTVRHCPSCGYSISSLDLFCPSCGSSLEDTKVAPSAQLLASNLSAIDSQKEGLIRNLIRTHQGNVSDKTTQKVNMIKSFPIPNTKKDLLEIMHMAASNINTKVLFGKPLNSDLSDDAYKTEKLLSEAWLDKMENIYQKAKALLSGDSDFPKIESLYMAKKNEIQSTRDALAKKNHKEKKTGSILLLVLFLGLLAILYLAEIKPNAEKANELDSLVVEIRQDISDGNYNEALLKTNKVRFKNGSTEDEVKWDQIRETLIKEIEDARK